LVDTQRRYIPEDGTLHNHRCENLTSYNWCLSWDANRARPKSRALQPQEPGRCHSAIKLRQLWTRFLSRSMALGFELRAQS
jgi:hypothetical protein